MTVGTILLIILLILIGGLAARSAYEVTHPEIRRYALRTDKLTAAEKVRIAFLSDLHSRSYGKGNIKLIRMIARTKPDFIILGGDMLTASRLRNRDELTISTLEGLGNIAPVFYVPGNHEKKLMESGDEKQSERWDDYLFELECMDLNWLADDHEIMTEDMNIYGLDIDERFYGKFGKSPKMQLSYIKDKVGIPDRRKFNILAAHSPEFIDTYAKTDFDLVLCGHYHGGQVRLPLIGGLIAPNIGDFPHYTKGLYASIPAKVVLSAGLGSDRKIPRINNPGEIVCVDLLPEK